MTVALKNRSGSELVRAGQVLWHVESAGTGEVILLVHGTAASSHSWRKVVPRLAETHRVITLDLPGHGRSDTLSSDAVSLENMASAMAKLLAELGARPRTLVGHSAGAVVLARLCNRYHCAASRMVSFNGAFFPLSGFAGSFFSPIAKIVSLNPLLPRILSYSATRHTVEKLLRDTGSRLGADDVEEYYSLFRSPSHVASAFRMMALWDLSEVERDLRSLALSVTLVAAEGDKTIPPKTAERAARLCPNATVFHIPGKGHLLHEEDAPLAAAIIRGDPPWQS
jgi:magnesium chelatase accessory protein